MKNVFVLTYCVMNTECIKVSFFNQIMRKKKHFSNLRLANNKIHHVDSDKNLLLLIQALILATANKLKFTYSPFLVKQGQNGCMIENIYSNNLFIHSI